MNRVSLDKIDVSDRSYCVSYPLEDDLLSSSVKRFGVLVPIGLLKSNPARIVTGFKRIAAAREAGIGEVPYVFLDAGVAEATLIAIADNLARGLNTVEKACCLEKMIAHGFSTEDVLAMARMMGLPAREKTLTTVAAMASMGEAERRIIANHALPLAVVEQMLSFDENEIATIVPFMDRIRMTSSHVREALQLFALMKVRQGHIDPGRWESAADGETLVGELRKVSYPILAALEERLGRIREASALPPHIRIQVDPVFERESVDIQVRVRSVAEVDRAIEKLGALSKQGIFRSIFDLTHGTPGRD